MFRRYRILFVLATLAISARRNSESAAAQRPPITGIANVALKTNDLAAARRFYRHDLGFAEPFQRKSASGAPAATFKVNEHQYVQITEDLKDDAEDRLTHIAFETTNAKQLRDYLASRAVSVPATVTPDSDGNLCFFVRDPEGHEIGFVQYGPRSLTARASGKFLPETRISERIIHAGVVAHDQAALDAFYKDILGFDEMWRGGRTDTSVDWVDMRVPDGDDWLEYMLNVRNTSSKTRGVMNHLALGVPSTKAAYQRLVDRGMTLAEQPKIGRDGKWQLNLYDPNLTRAELMEPKPVEKPCCSEFKYR